MSKNQEERANYYLYIDGQAVPVSEEIYRVYQHYERKEEYFCIGVAVGGMIRLVVYVRSKNAKKYRHNEEYGSARWGTAKDIEPFADPVFENNVILTRTESLTMNSRPADPKTARNKNVLIVGGSGSGKTRFWLKPNLLQCTSKTYPTSFVVTDPNGNLQ